MAQKKATTNDVGSFGIKPYEPSKDEEYMNEDQEAHFRKILSAWKDDLM
jgi:DnaK suppressor protein